MRSLAKCCLHIPTRHPTPWSIMQGSIFRPELSSAHPLGMPHPKIDEQARASMHECGGATASGEEPVGLLYTNLMDPSGLADLLLDERVDIRLVRGTCLKALDREKQTFIRRQELEHHPRYPDAFVTREELQKWKEDKA